jgi:biopolymer transport protein ExbB
MFANRTRAWILIGMLVWLAPALCLASPVEVVSGLSERINGFFTKGGAFLYMNCAMLAWGLIIIVERFVFIYMRYNINARPFMAQIEKLVVVDDLERAIKLCNAAPAAALPKVIRAGLAKADRGEVEIESAMQEVKLYIVPVLESRTSNLIAIAHLSILLGLLGTVSGLISAFAAVGSASPDLRLKELSEGVAEALTSTAFGLTIAVICRGAHLFLANMSKKIIDEIHHHAVKMRNILMGRVKAPSAPTSTPA